MQNQSNFRYSPWGAPDNVEVIAPGVTRIDTPSHGGYHLSSDRLAALPKALRSLPTFAGTGWYEEDCDWIIPVLAFPDLFQPRSCYCAVETAKSHSGDYPLTAGAKAWLSDPAAAAVIAKAATFQPKET